jgi:hypothetical protein
MNLLLWVSQKFGNKEFLLDEGSPRNMSYKNVRRIGLYQNE